MSHAAAKQHHDPTKTLTDIMAECEHSYKHFKETIEDLYRGKKIHGSVFFYLDKAADEMLEDTKKKVTKAKESKDPEDVFRASGWIEACIEWLNKPLLETI